MIVEVTSYQPWNWEGKGFQKGDFVKNVPDHLHKKQWWIEYPQVAKKFPWIYHM